MSASPRLVSSLFALAIAAVATPAYAQKAPPAPAAIGPDYEKELGALLGISGGLTADQAASRAAQESPDARRKRFELASAHAQVEQAKLARIPRVDATLRYTRLSPVTLPAFFASLAPAGLKLYVPNNYNADASLNVPISDYFIRIPYQIDAAKAGEQSAIIAEKSAALGAALDARVAYYEWVRARLQVVVAKKLVEQVGQTVSQVSALVDVQRASRADLLRLQAQKAQADLALVQAHDTELIREEQLRILIAAAPEEQLAIGEDVRADIALPTVGNSEDMAREALGRRLEARALTATEEQLIRTERAQKADRYPKLSAFAQAQDDKPNQRALGSTDLQFTWALGVQLTWSPNDLLVSDTRVDDSEAKIRAIGADRDHLSDGVRAEVQSDVQMLDISRQALVNTAEALTSAEEGYRVRKELLDAERVTAVELVDAEAELTQARIAAIDAKIDLRIAMARLQHALGLDVQ